MSLARGPVTLVFTDIQGSTELWERLGDAFTRSLQRHNRIVREYLARHGGTEVKTEGDAFMIAFPGAAAALRFAVEAQVALAAAGWEAGAEVLVRMGIHSGPAISTIDPTTGRTDYLGPVVNRAARVAGAGHGGQTLVSSSAWDEAGGAPADCAVLDLGEHRLRGLEDPERLRQVLPAALAHRRFPPLRTLSIPTTNLPRPATSFVGRERELAELAERVEQAPGRLVTMTGPGGAGKTRLAIQLGHSLVPRYDGGVWFADLSEARSPAEAAHAVVRALGAALPAGVPPEEGAARVLEYRPPLLLVLDNFEQIAPHAPATVGRWLEDARRARFLVTSRTLLRIAGEREYELAPLPVPSGKERSRAETNRYDAVRLFCARAGEARPGFELSDANAPAIASICTELDGIPLAIELAAARTRILRPDEIARRLGQLFALLRTQRTDLPPRQRTLEGAIDWGYDLLPEAEKRAFLQACVFRGGFFPEAAEEVLEPGGFAAIDAVQSLREKSFLRAWDTPLGTRFGFYQPIRDYGRQKWKAVAGPEEREALARRHAGATIGYASRWDGALETPDGQEALDRIESERENLFDVQDWALSAGRPELAAAAILAAARTLAARGPASERVPRLERSLASLPDPPGETALQLETALAEALRDLGAWDRAEAVGERAARRAADFPGSRWAAEALLVHGSILRRRGRMAEAQTALEESERSFRRLGCRSGISRCVGQRAILDRQKGDLEKALAALSEALDLAREIGDERAIASHLGNRGVVQMLRGDLELALGSLEEAEELARRIGDLPGTGTIAGNIAIVHRRRGDLEGALDRLTSAEAIAREAGDKHSVGRHACNRGNVLLALGDEPGALACYGEAEAVARSLGDRQGISINLGNRASILRRRGDLGAARSLVEESAALARELGDRAGSATALGEVGTIALLQGDLAGAGAALEEALRLHEELGTSETEPAFHVRIRLAELREKEGDPGAARALAARARELAGRLGLEARDDDPDLADAAALLDRLAPGS